MKLICQFLSGILLLVVILTTACESNHPLPVDNCNFVNVDQDSLLVDLVTYIYRPPNKVSAKDRFLATYRNWFIESSSEFEWLHCHMDGENQIYFYMLRPARNIHDHKRGVAGKFSLSEDGEVISFEEIFNTHMIPSEEVKSLGKKLFGTLVQHGQIPKDSDLWKHIEFPGDSNFYDMEIYEWSYRTE